MTQRVLITGGCGFVGINLIEHLRANTPDLCIRIFDNESLGQREHVAGLGCEFVHGDILDEGAVKRAVQGSDALVHLAAHTRVVESTERPRDNLLDNVIGSFNVFMACRDAGVKRVIVASTGGAIMGDVEPPVHEMMVPHPISPYGASKLAMEGYADAFAGSYGLNVTALRFSNLYGPHSYHKGSAIAAFYRQILSGQTLTIYGDGSQQRDFLYVGDVASVICDLLIGPEKRGIFQLGSGKPTRLDQIIAIMTEIIGPQWPIKIDHQPARAGEIHSTWCDITKARRDIVFAPTTPLELGLRKTWHWFETHVAPAS